MLIQFLIYHNSKSQKNLQFLKKNKFNTEYYINTIYGKSTSKLPRACSHCKSSLINHINQHINVKLKHLAINNVQIIIEVEYIQLICPCCGKTTKQEIVFKHPNHFITNCYFKQLKGLINSSQIAIKTISQALFCNRKLIKEIDKARLKEKYKDMNPTHYSKYIAVDEFSIQKGHRYATVVIDWISGEILFLEKGNSENQLIHFFNKMGNDWMNHVEAISMDMNAQYNCAVENNYPHIKVVYDGFHIIKSFNDRILTELRRAEQNKLRNEEKHLRENIEILKSRKRKYYKFNNKKEINDTIAEFKLQIQEINRKYKEFKNTRFIITSSQRALRIKDSIAKTHNKILYEKYEKVGLKIPEGERKWAITNEKRLKNILAANDNLNTAYFLGDQLKAGLDSTNEVELKIGLDKWLKLSRSFEKEIPMLITFNTMIEKRKEGILSRVEYPISTGPLEGLNNMIKVTKRVAYGYRDMEYFFLKLFDKSRHNIKHRTFKQVLEKRHIKNLAF